MIKMKTRGENLTIPKQSRVQRWAAVGMFELPCESTYSTSSCYKASHFVSILFS